MQPTSSPPHQLQIEDDMDFQRRNWTAERIGWAVMAFVVIAAMVGLFAGGPLSSTTASNEKGTLKIDYERMQRQSSPVTIKVRVASQPVVPEIAIEVNEVFGEAFRITEIRPQPTRSVAIADGMRFHFATVPNAPATVYFHLTPRQIGFVEPNIGIEGQDRVRLPTFIYP